MELIFLFIGVLFGVSICRLISRQEQNSGTLHIDVSNVDDGPHLFLEISENPYRLQTRTHVKLKIKTTNFLSQK